MIEKVTGWLLTGLLTVLIWGFWLGVAAGAGYGGYALVDYLWLDDSPAEVAEPVMDDEWREDAYETFVARACYDVDTGRVNPLCKQQAAPASTEPPTQPSTIEANAEAFMVTMNCDLQAMFTSMDYDSAEWLLNQITETPALFEAHYRMLEKYVPEFVDRMETFVDECSLVLPAQTAGIAVNWQGFVANWEAVQRACYRDLEPQGFVC